MSRNKSIIKHPESIVFLLFPLVFVFWFIFYRHHILYWEESGFFVHTWEYFKRYLEQPGGLSDYVGYFITQFYRWPVVGAILQTLFLVIVWYCVRGILNKIYPDDKWLVFRIFPVLFVFALQCSNFFVVAESVRIMLFFALNYFYLSVKKQHYRYLTFIFLFPLIFILLSPGGVIALYFTFILYECWKSRGPVRYLIIPIWIILPLCYPYVWKHTVCLIPAGKLYTLSQIDQMPFAGRLVYITYAWVILLFLYTILVRKRVAKKQIIIYLLNIAMILGMGYYLFQRVYEREFEQLMTMDHAIRSGNEDKVFEVVQSIKNPNTGILYFATLALAKQDALPERLFDFPVNGSECLYLPRTLEYLNMVWGSELYNTLGVYNEAIHWNFDASVSTPWSVDFRTLKSLIELHLKKKDFGLAEKYLQILDNATLYSKWVDDRYREIELLKRDQNLPETEVGGNNFFIGARPFLSDMARVFDAAPSNRKVVDYILCGLLLDRELGKFISILRLSPYTSVKKLPKVYEEALMVAIDMGKQDPSAYPITFETRQAFQEYTRITAQYQGKLSIAKQALQKYNKTFWYYLQFANQGNR